MDFQSAIATYRDTFHQEGIIQVLSLLPTSYPGNSLLTEDLGMILGEDDCKCGRKGKYFVMSGRMKESERPKYF